MHALSEVSREHHTLLRDRTRRLYELAECLCPDCLDTLGARSELPEIRAVVQELRESLLPHMDAAEASIYPVLERLIDDPEASIPLRREHTEIRQLMARIDTILDDADTAVDRYWVLALRRVMLRLHVLLKTHLVEWELYLPILEDRLMPEGEAALARALDHQASASL